MQYLGQETKVVYAVQGGILNQLFPVTEWLANSVLLHSQQGVAEGAVLWLPKR
jgi:hypothetical protein